MNEPGSSASLTVELRGSADAVWEAQHRHPFVRGVGDGTLEPERFNVWVRQDYLYLIEFARLHALGTARAPGLQAMTRFADITQGLLGMEMDLHRSYAAELGISSAQLEREEMLPTTQGYTDFLVRTAAVGDFVELTAARCPASGAMRRSRSAWPTPTACPMNATDAGSPCTPHRSSPSLPAGPASSPTTPARMWVPRVESGLGARFSPAAATNSPFGRWPGPESTGWPEPDKRALRRVDCNRRAWV